MPCMLAYSPHVVSTYEAEVLISTRCHTCLNKQYSIIEGLHHALQQVLQIPAVGVTCHQHIAEDKNIRNLCQPRLQSLPKLCLSEQPVNLHNYNYMTALLPHMRVKLLTCNSASCVPDDVRISRQQSTSLLDPVNITSLLDSIGYPPEHIRAL